MSFKPYTGKKLRRKQLEFVRGRIRIRIQNRIHYPGSGSPDPHQNDTDPKH